MASFKDWALQYVLADDPAEARDIAAKAAQEIENSRAASTVVGNWASSIHQWMRGSDAGSDAGRDGEATGDGGDIIARAKALGFLASTLEALDPAALKRDQVHRLCLFFGSMFSVDHKAGITASATALRRLVSAKSFKPDTGVGIIEDVCKMGDDFRLQTAATRLQVYELFLELLRDPAVAAEIRAKYDSTCGFAGGLVQLCRNERDPKNLMVWFEILRIIVAEYAPAEEAAQELFKAFSAYFPISIRSSATTAGVTADDLKGALRDCFSAHRRLAPVAFPFLLQKLDQADAITVSVKLDILRSIQACVENYDDPQDSLLPYTDGIWNSLKYEVRNGEVKETIDATLDVLRSIAKRLDGTPAEKLDIALLKRYVDLVFGDCNDDLSNPTYTKQAGLLLTSVAASSVRAFILESQTVVGSIGNNLRQPKSPSHTRDLLTLYNSLLLARSALVEARQTAHAGDKDVLEEEPLDHLRGLFYEVYLPLWRENSVAQPTADQEAILETTIRGMGLLCSQKAALPGGRTTLLSSPTVCSEVCALFVHRILSGLTLSSNDSLGAGAGVGDEMVLALRRVTMNYRDGFSALVEGSKSAIKSRDWRSPSKQSLEALKTLMSRLAFVGCSEIPPSPCVTDSGEGEEVYSPLDHFATLTGALLEVFEWLLDNNAVPLAAALVLSGLHGALRNFADACPAVPAQGLSLARIGDPSADGGGWLDEFKQAISGCRIPPDWVRLLSAGYGFSIEQQHGLDPDTKVAGGQGGVLEGFARLSLFVVRHLVLRLTKESPGSDNNGTVLRAADEVVKYQQQGSSPDPILLQLAGMASFTIRRLDSHSQKAYDLAAEAFQLFRTPSVLPPVWIGHSDDTLSMLSLGILESLWPDAMVDLYKPGGIAETVMTSGGGDSLPTRPGHTSSVAGSILTILANKYKGGPSTSDPDSQTFKSVLEYWKSQMSSVAATSGEESGHSEPRLVRALSVLSGSLARQDRDSLGLVPLLHEAAGAASDSALARSLQILVQDKAFLTRETHAVIKPLYKQWAYAHLVKPLYKTALPALSGDLPRAENYTVAVLSILKHCPYTIYADDIGPLVRLLLTSLLGIPSLYDRQAALRILLQVLHNEPSAVRDHLKTVVDASARLFELASTPPPPAAVVAALDANPAACRRLVLQLLGELPGKFDERHLLPYSPRMRRMLARASGDPVREVRKAALAARIAWTNAT